MARSSIGMRILPFQGGEMGSTPIRAIDESDKQLRDVGQWQARVFWAHDRVGSIPAIPTCELVVEGWLPKPG